MTHADTPSFEQRMRRVADLAQQIEQAGDHPLAGAARQVTAALLDLHAEALRHLLAHVESSGEAGRELTSRLVADPLVSSLLLLHGLHPEPLQQRIDAALAQVRRQLRLEHDQLRLIEVDGGHVRVGLRAGGCSSTAAALRSAVERSLTAAAPDADGLHIEDLADSAAPPPLVQVGLPASRQPA